jgi:hypothetical protein
MKNNNTKELTSLTYKQVIDIYDACVHLAKNELPIWWTLVRNIQELQVEYDKFNKAKQQIIDKYSIKDKEGKIKLLPTSDDGVQYVDFGDIKNAEIAGNLNNELLNETVLVNLKTVSINKCKGFALKPSDMYNLVGTVLTGELED